MCDDVVLCIIKEVIHHQMPICLSLEYTPLAMSLFGPDMFINTTMVMSFLNVTSSENGL